INILIPVIEGAIRHYLVNYEGKEPAKVLGKEELIKIFNLMQERIRRGKMEYYGKHFVGFVNRNISFTKQQAQLLTNQAVKFYTYWFDIIKDFFSNNLYWDTKGSPVPDSFNLH